MAAKWRDLGQSPQVTAKAFEQAEETSWRDKDDTAFVAQQQASTQFRWKSFFTTRYDREIFAVLFPALLAIFLDPVMILVDTGMQWNSLTRAPLEIDLSAASTNQCCSQTTFLCGGLVALCACSYRRKVRNAAIGGSGAQQPPFLLLYCLLQLLISSHHTQSSQRSCESGP